MIEIPCSWKIFFSSAATICKYFLWWGWSRVIVCHASVKIPALILRLWVFFHEGGVEWYCFTPQLYISSLVLRWSVFGMFKENWSTWRISSTYGKEIDRLLAWIRFIPVKWERCWCNMHCKVYVVPSDRYHFKCKISTNFLMPWV